MGFASDSTNVLGPGGDTKGFWNVFVRGADPADPNGIDAKLFPDGELDDAVLEAVDAATGAITTLCPADAVSVSNGNAAFLRPESAVETSSPTATRATCPGGSLNPPDADLTDDVVQLWTGGTTVNDLGRAGTAVSMAPKRLAALISEDGDGQDYPGQPLIDTTVVQLHSVANPAAAWHNLAQAADTVVMSDNAAVFITPEADQNAILNDDGDKTDRVLQVAYAEAPAPAAPFAVVDVGQAADEFVVGSTQDTACGLLHLVAFRTSEADQDAGPLSGDLDTSDHVMQVYDLVSGALKNTGQAVIASSAEWIAVPHDRPRRRVVPHPCRIDRGRRGS